MKIISCEIKNFRSIENMKFNLEHDTKILVGLSETGKSNILKALKYFSKDEKIDKRDIREGYTTRDESTLTFKVRLEDNEIKEIIQKLKEIFIDDLSSKIYFEKGKEKKYIKDILIRDYLYKVDLGLNEKGFRYYTIAGNAKFQSGENYYIVPATSEKNITLNKVTLKGDIISTVFDRKIVIDGSKYNLESQEDIIPLEIEELNKLVSEVVINYLKENSLDVLLWKYEDKFILPSEINIEEFVNNPDICLPLKKIFELSDINNIKEEYDSKKSTGRSTTFDNLLEKISKKATSYLRKKWESMPKETKIEIYESGDKIKISIKDSQSKFEMFDRSDGYKRFVSFLIMISIDHSTNNFKNKLLLIDCPEAEIDIPGQKYLRNELIEIGKDNYVFFSTHSPYMVDNNKISRHYIVAKEKEKTSYSIADDSNYNDSAVLFSALGASLYENVCDYNIILEGWDDKQLYKAGLFLLDKTEIKKFDKLGLCHLGGLRNVPYFAAICELVCKTKNYIFISDSDKAAIDEKRKFVESIRDEKFKWLSYGDCIKERKIETAEDFLQEEYIVSICNNYGKDNGFEHELNIGMLKNTILSCLYIWLNKNKITGDNQKNSIREIKIRLFENLNIKNIKDDYKKVLELILSNLN